MSTEWTIELGKSWIAAGVAAALSCLLATGASAQRAPQPSGAAAQRAQQASDNPLSTWLKTAYINNRNNIVRTADKMPEENYGMRPGTQQEVRTFGQQVGHLADFNYLWCSQAKGEKNPNAGNNLEKLTTKDEFTKALNDAFAYCDNVYATLTDAAGTEMIDITQESGRQTRNLRMALLILNYGHNNEIYGSMVSYLRMKNIVPPASEPRPPAPPAQPGGPPQ